MYGTVNELAARLLRDYPAHEKLTLIIWSLQDVHDYAEEPALTDAEAGQILADIDTLCTHEGGVGGETIGTMAENIRKEARAMREITVPAHAQPKGCMKRGQMRWHRLAGRWKGK